MPKMAKKKPIIAKTPDQSIADGKSVFARTCLACHQSEGQGIKGVFPPLATSDFLNNNKEKAIDAVLFGLKGEITVNGEAYNPVMPGRSQTGQEVADVVNYVYNNWGNNKTFVTPINVRDRRAK